MAMTRRKFVMLTASGLSLSTFGAQPVAPTSIAPQEIGSLRHIHLDLPAGPYSRAELAHIIARAAQALGLPGPESATALGAALYADPFPAEFVLTCRYPVGLRFVVRASRTHNGVPEFTFRGTRRDTEFRYSFDRIV